MNSFEWNENTEILYDAIDEYCIEEKIDINDKQQYINELFQYYSQQKHTITSKDKLNEINKKILSTFVNYTKNNNDYIKLKPRELVQQQYYNDNNIYSKEDILKQRQNTIQQSYDYIKDDFNKFNNNKPPEINFKEDDDDNENISMDERIQREILNRKNELSNINYDMPNTDNSSKKVHFNKDSIDNSNSVISNDNNIVSIMKNSNKNIFDKLKRKQNNSNDNKIQLLESKIDNLQKSVDNILHFLHNSNTNNKSDLSSNSIIDISLNNHI